MPSNDEAAALYRRVQTEVRSKFKNIVLDSDQRKAVSTFLAENTDAKPVHIHAGYKALESDATGVLYTKLEEGDGS